MPPIVCSVRLVILLIVGLSAGLVGARAQGGPPMLTDDPGTPGNGHWEINLAWTDQRTPGVTEFGLPLLDANYGLGDRIQLNYQTSWTVFRADGDRASDGLSNSELAVKWRFYDEGERGWQMSTFPRIAFLDPGSHSDRRGLADRDATYLIPFQIARNFGIVSVNVELGRTFSSKSENEGWVGGVCVGGEVRKGFELDAEAFEVASVRANRSEVIVNLGSRIDITEHLTLLLAIGRDCHNTRGPRASLLSYAGVQLRL